MNKSIVNNIVNKMKNKPDYTSATVFTSTGVCFISLTQTFTPKYNFTFRKFGEETSDLLFFNISKGEVVKELEKHEIVSFSF